MTCDPMIPQSVRAKTEGKPRAAVATSSGEGERLPIGRKAPGIAAPADIQLWFD